MTFAPTIRMCSRCHQRPATRVLPSEQRPTHYCDTCEPSKVEDFRRLVRLDVPAPKPPAQQAALEGKIRRLEADVAGLLEANKKLRDARTVVDTQVAGFWRDLQAAADNLHRQTERAKELEKQLAEGARAYERLTAEAKATSEGYRAIIDEKDQQLRAAEVSSAHWESKATDYKRERDAATEKLGRAVKARDEYHDEVLQLRRRVAVPVPAPQPIAPAAPAPMQRTSLSSIVATMVPARGVRPIVIPPDIDLAFSVLPSDNRSKIAQAIRDYLCGRRAPFRARGVDDAGRPVYELRAGKFLISMGLDNRGDEFVVHIISAGAA
jgi:hypothetical protein